MLEREIVCTRDKCEMYAYILIEGDGGVLVSSLKTPLKLIDKLALFVKRSGALGRPRSGFSRPDSSNPWLRKEREGNAHDAGY